jgi:hypothetical protein
MSEALEMAKGNTPHSSPEITLLHMPPILMADVSGAPPITQTPPKLTNGTGHANGNGSNGHIQASKPSGS